MDRLSNGLLVFSASLDNSIATVQENLGQREQAGSVAIRSKCRLCWNAYDDSKHQYQLRLHYFSLHYLVTRPSGYSLFIPPFVFCSSQGNTENFNHRRSWVKGA